ncbi:hypothetical protein B0H11DRAFT_1922116 [Mycena galericulata]|nr:hypothetical protein B0H11DRAFT_1922116 [Mycena galericulata]
MSYSIEFHWESWGYLKEDPIVAATTPSRKGVALTIMNNVEREKEMPVHITDCHGIGENVAHAARRAGSIGVPLLPIGDSGNMSLKPGMGCEVKRIEDGKSASTGAEGFRSQLSVDVTPEVLRNRGPAKRDIRKRAAEKPSQMRAQLGERPYLWIPVLARLPLATPPLRWQAMGSGSVWREDPAQMPVGSGGLLGHSGDSTLGFYGS